MIRYNDMTDAEIQQAVLHELKWDTRVEETGVDVEVHNAIVMLKGTASSYAKRLAAQEAAHRVAGVLDVANDIKVKVPGDEQRNDTDIAHAVRRALEWDVFVPERRLRSTVSDGWVTLEGSVDCWSEREDAEKAVRNLAGVKGVFDNIVISPPAVLHTEVRRAIGQALERQADREARKIHFDVKDGHVNLSGVVHSWAERKAVVGAARGTRGVRDVEDHLRIERTLGRKRRVLPSSPGPEWHRRSPRKPAAAIRAPGR
jgi:osmotically-inducible protein OsmY